jgi:surface protein
MSGMFSSTPQFNGDVSEWDVSSVTNMSHMFRGAVQSNSNSSYERVGCS